MSSVLKFPCAIDFTNQTLRKSTALEILEVQISLKQKTTAKILRWRSDKHFFSDHLSVSLSEETGIAKVKAGKLQTNQLE